MRFSFVHYVKNFKPRPHVSLFLFLSQSLEGSVPTARPRLLKIALADISSPSAYIEVFSNFHIFDPVSLFMLLTLYKPIFSLINNMITCCLHSQCLATTLAEWQAYAARLAAELANSRAILRETLRAFTQLLDNIRGAHDGATSADAHDNDEC